MIYGDEAQPARQTDYDPIYTPETDDDAFIVGRTLRPDEPVTAGTSRQPVDRSVFKALPLLERAAEHASPEYKGIVNLLLREAR